MNRRKFLVGFSALGMTFITGLACGFECDSECQSKRSKRRAKRRNKFLKRTGRDKVKPRDGKGGDEKAEPWKD